MDPNLLQDQLFVNGIAQPGSPAAARMDLLTVVLHEMGQVDDWTELDPPTNPDALMALTLGTGQRRIQGARCSLCGRAGISTDGTKSGFPGTGCQPDLSPPASWLSLQRGPQQLDRPAQNRATLTKTAHLLAEVGVS